MLQALIGPVTGLLDKFIPDADQKAKLAHEIATMSEKHAQEALLAQLEINKAEAASGSIFKGGWRPAVGWVCAIAFLYHFLLLSQPCFRALLSNLYFLPFFSTILWLTQPRFLGCLSQF